MQDHGYQCSILQFCGAAVSTRNKKQGILTCNSTHCFCTSIVFYNIPLPVQQCNWQPLTQAHFDGGSLRNQRNWNSAPAKSQRSKVYPSVSGLVSTCLLSPARVGLENVYRAWVPNRMTFQVVNPAQLRLSGQLARLSLQQDPRGSPGLYPTGGFQGRFKCVLKSYRALQKIHAKTSPRDQKSSLQRLLSLLAPAAHIFDAGQWRAATVSLDPDIARHVPAHAHRELLTAAPALPS